MSVWIKGFTSLVLALSMVVVVPPTRAYAETIVNDGGVPKTTAIFPMLYSQNLMVKFVLASYGKSDKQKISAVKEAQALITKFASQQHSMHRAETQADMENVKSLYFPQFDSLADEIEYRRTADQPPFLMVTGGNDDLESQLQILWDKQQARLEELAHLPTVWRGKGDQTSLNRWLAETMNATGSLTDLSTDKMRLAFVNRMHDEVKKGIDQIDSTGTIITSSGALNHTDPGMKRFFELAIGEYFRNLSPADKLNIVSTFVDHPDNTTARQKFEIMVLTSGPQFQKLFQVYAREKGFSDEMRAIFKQLEDNARSTPYRLVKDMIAAETPPFKILQVSPKPLGVGTMAQVHRAKIQLADGTTKDVVVRVLKYKIAERLASDSAVLRKMAPEIDADPILKANAFPQITPFVNEIIAMGQKELDVPATVRAQQRASLVYNKDVVVGKAKIRFHVPEVYVVSPTSNVMVQEFVPGTSFETFSHQQPALGLTAVEEISRLWVEEALLGSGFFHADLHQGNMRMSKFDGGVQVNLLDYGMTGSLSRQMQRQILALSMVLGSRKPDLMAKALWELSVQDKNQVTRDQLAVAIQKEMVRVSQAGLPAYEFGGWVSFAANVGIKFPPEFTSLNRGITLISQMLVTEKSTLTMDQILRKPISRSPGLMLEITKSLDSISGGDWAKIMWNAARGKQDQVPVHAPACKALLNR